MTIHVNVNKANIRWNSRDIIRIAQHVSLFAVAAPACIMHNYYSYEQKMCTRTFLYYILSKSEYIYISRYDDDGHINTMYANTSAPVDKTHTTQRGYLFKKFVHLHGRAANQRYASQRKLTPPPYACMCSFVWYRFDPFIEIGS